MGSNLMTTSYWELEKYLEHAEEEISRTFSELCCNLQTERQFKRDLPRKPRRKKRSSRDRRRAKTVELSFRSHPNLENRVPTVISPHSTESSSASPSPNRARKYRNRISPIPSDRCTSVRDLPSALPQASIMSRSTGSEAISYSTPRLDFSSTDSVNKWASQILAEIDSLPGSCAELGPSRRRAEKEDEEADLREAKRRLDDACSQLYLLSVPNNKSLTKSNAIDNKDNKCNGEQSATKAAKLQNQATSDSDSLAKIIQRLTPTLPPEEENNNITPKSSPRKQKAVMSDASTSICNDEEIYSVPKLVGGSKQSRVPLDRTVRGVVASIIRQAETHIPPLTHIPPVTHTHKPPLISSGHKSAFTPVNIANTVRAPCLPSLPPAPPLEPLFDPCFMHPSHTQHEDTMSLCSTPDLQDAFTQTTPTSLSRSSSFTWMSDGEPDGELPTMELPQQLRLESPADDAEGLAQFLHLADVHSINIGKEVNLRVPTPSSISSTSLAGGRVGSFQEELAGLSDASIDGLSDECSSPKAAMEESFDQSLQLLLDYSIPQPTSKIHQNSIHTRKFNMEESKPSPTRTQNMKSCDVPYTNENVQYTNENVQYTNENVQYTNEIPRPHQVNWTRHPLMSESIYDNVNNGSSGSSAAHKNRKTNAYSNQNISPIPVSSSLSRDYSILSGQLADSESSPMTPDPGFAILDATATALTPDSAKSITSSDSSFCRVNAQTYSEQLLRQNFDNKNKILPSEMSMSLQVHRDPPPPSPQPHHMRGPRSGSSTASATFRSQSLAANSLPSLDRAESYDYLERPAKKRTQPDGGRAESGTNLNSQGSDSGFSSSKEKAEAEARESCRWLRAAGFPQYAQMYEAHRFPIDITAAQRDHEFLDQDSIHALFRRLHTLNRSALMKIDSNSVVLRRQFEDDSEEEDDTVALSRQWRYQRKSRTWSRVGDDLDTLDIRSQNLAPILSPRHTIPADAGSATGGSVDSLPSYTPRSNDNSVHVMVAKAARDRERQSYGPKEELGVSGTRPEGGSSRLQRSQSERIKDKARAFMRRVELIGRRKNPLPNPRASSLSTPRHHFNPDMNIGSPKLVSHESHVPGSIRRRMEIQKRLDGSTGSLHASPRLMHKHAEEDRRYGRVFMTESQYPSLLENRPLTSSITESTENYLQQTFVDKNSNIDRILVQKCTRSGIRTNGNIGRSIRDPSDPLVTYNPLFPVGDGASSRTPNRPPSPAVQNSIEDEESSPDMYSTRNQHPLKVRVEVQPSTNNTPPQPSQSSIESSDTDSPRYWEPPERRDSGVGSSLSRSPSGPLKSRASRISTVNRAKKQPTKCSILLELDNLSVPQMITLRQMALLKLTALLERFASAPNSRAAAGWPWGVQRLFRKIKNPDAKGLKDRHVFGVSLTSNVQKYGQPLPQCIQGAMRFLCQQSPEAVGIFRKSGVRSRIMKLRLQAESTGDVSSYDSSQVYDVADMVKQYFRELPEPLLTSKLSETFLGIVLYIPPDLQLEALQYAVLLLPDENREALHTLLAFLNDIAGLAAKNKMSAENLAMCFAPSLFQLSSRVAALSPTRRHKTITGGLPNEKELREQAAAQTCFTMMIKKCAYLFTVPEHMRDRFLNEREAPLLRELGGGDYNAYLDGCVKALLKEHRDRWKGWMTEGSQEGVEMCSKKPQDGHPLKYWRCWTDIEAPPCEVLRRVIFERDVWDGQVVKWRVLNKLSNSSEIFQYVLNDMAPHPTREYLVVRSWRSELPELRGGCVLVETSVSVPEASLMGGVRSLCLASRFLIEPSGSGRSRITYVARLDTKGRGKAWYHKVFGYRCAHQLAQLRDSFRQIAEGPETKV